MNPQECKAAETVRWKTLIVDDSVEECRLFDACLSLIPEVHVLGCVHDGDEAIAYLRGDGHFGDRQKFPYPDLLLLDFRMPRCDGVEVLAALNRMSRRPRIVFWSNSLVDMDQGLVSRLGADLICLKPTRLTEFNDLLARLDADPTTASMPSAKPAHSTARCAQP